MTRTHVSAALRRAIAARAHERCEYCLFPREFAFASFEMEHIIAEKHHGATTLDNLAYACQDCNRLKGTDLGSIDPLTGQFAFFFNPRTHVWTEHFRLEGAHIIPLTPEGRVTVDILQFNHPERLLEREQLIRLRSYL